MSWWCHQKYVNQITSNCLTLWILDLPIFNVFVWILLVMNLSLNQTLLIFLLDIRQSWKTQLIEVMSLCERLSFFNSKGYITQIHSLVRYVKEGLTFAWDSSQENSEYSYLCFQLALFWSVFYDFSIYQSMPSCLCSVLDFISSSKDEIVSINP